MNRKIFYDKLLLKSANGPAKEELAAYKEAYETWEKNHGEDYKQWREGQPVMPADMSIARAAERNPEIEGFVKTGTDEGQVIKFNIKRLHVIPLKLV